MGSVSMSGALIAACVHERGRLTLQGAPHVVVWHVPTRTQLRTLTLPTRQHACWHPNVVVQHSVSMFAWKMAIEDYRIVLSCQVKHGDWRELVGDAHGDAPPYYATALLVVQEVGPEWLRGHEAAPAAP